LIAAGSQQMMTSHGLGALAAALIAAGAVVAGGLLTSVPPFLLERSRRKREDSERQEKEERDWREASRLLLAELSEIDQAIQHSVRSKLTWPLSRQLPANAWQEYRGALASQPELPLWRFVSGAYNAANSANWKVIELAHEFETDGPVHLDDSKWLRTPFRSVRTAMEELDKALPGSKGAYAYTGYVSIEELEQELWPPTPSSGSV
jgi:hypothetical protein